MEGADDEAATTPQQLSMDSKLEQYKASLLEYQMANSKLTDDRNALATKLASIDQQLYQARSNNTSIVVFAVVCFCAILLVYFVAFHQPS